MTVDTTQPVDIRLTALLDQQPPQPGRGRFQPLRIGLLGIWEYSEQEFTFYDGRLILRGRNGSGKTKVLEVTSPFLFDADLTARRLDPFGTAARSMRDNLLFGDKKHQIGYVWCEYGRIDESGVERFVTIGAGLRAQRSKAGAPESWYFVTPLRVGSDFSLMDAKRNAHNQRALTEILSEEAVFESATSYRTVVADRLFGTTVERFRSLVELLIALRRPKLSENFGIAKLAEMLSSALPPIDPDLVEELARGFDELLVDQEDLARIVDARREIETFTSAYRTYVRRVVRMVAGRVRSAVTGYDDVTRKKSAAEQRLADANATKHTLLLRKKDLEHHATEQSARVRALERRPEIEQHEMLLQLKQLADAAERAADRAARRLRAAVDELARSRDELESAERRLVEREAEAEELESRALDLATRSDLRLEHELETERLRAETAAARRMLTTVITARSGAVRQVRRLRKEVTAAQVAVDKAQAAHDGTVVRRELAASEVVRCQAELDAQIEAVTHTLLSWAEDCREIRMSNAELDELIDIVQVAGEPSSSTVTSRVLTLTAAVQRGLFRNKADLDAQLEREEQVHAEVVAEQERIATGRDEAPPDPLVLRRDRSDRPVPGAPLWKLVDFAPHMPEYDRANIEAALLGAGLLDAWVTPDGALLDPDTLDVTFRPGVPVEGTALSSALLVSEDPAVPRAVVDALLAAVGLRDGDDAEVVGPWVSKRGAWSIGPLRGRTEGTVASYIGASAREKARGRKLAALAERRTAIEQGLAELQVRREELDQRIDRLDEERRTAPDDLPIRDARSALDAALKAAATADGEEQDAARKLDARKIEAESVEGHLAQYATEHAIDPDETALEALETALSSYQDTITELTSVMRSVTDYRATAATARDRTGRQQDSTDRQEHEAEESANHAVETRAEYDARFELDGADIEQVLQELHQAKNTLAGLQDELKAVTDALGDAAQQVGEATSELKNVVEEKGQQEGVRAAAVADFDRLRGHKLLELIGMAGIGAERPSMTRTIEDARSAEHLLRAEDISERAQNSARNTVDERFREMQRTIGSADWRPWGEHDGDLFLVRISHNGTDYDVLGMMEILAAEIETRQSLIDSQERDLFGKVLVGKVGQHLRRCRLEARSLVNRMNELLAERPTASGLLMDLQWEADPNAGEEAARALQLLDGQAPDYLSEDRRIELIDFLVGRVQSVRQERESEDWKAYLREALDYRTWCRFRIRVKKPLGQWADLTDGRHQQGSGGEKAIMLQLPLFVAAAAHYQAVGHAAPHPVYLDEAFAGIDQEMRGSCMGLLTDLDLDFVMASHDEWGFHAEVPGVVTYDLLRDPELATVLATPFVWDGEREYQLADPLAVISDQDSDDDPGGE